MSKYVLEQIQMFSPGLPAVRNAPLCSAVALKRASDACSHSEKTPSVSHVTASGSERWRVSSVDITLCLGHSALYTPPQCCCSLKTSADARVDERAPPHSVWDVIIARCIKYPLIISSERGRQLDNVRTIHRCLPPALSATSSSYPALLPH